MLKKWREKLKSSERVRRRQSSALQATGVESTVFEQIAVHRRSSSSSSSLNSPQIRPQRTMTAATLGNITHPYFVNIHPDPQLHKALVYVLRPGTVYIGREAHPDPSVQVVHNVAKQSKKKKFLLVVSTFYSFPFQHFYPHS